MKKILKLCLNTSEWSPSRSEWLRLNSILPKSERDRIGAYVYKRDSKNSLVGQILLRIGLKRIVPHLEWPSMVIERNQKGRPCVKLKETDLDSSIIDSNLSHSGDLCVVVVGIRPIGKSSCNESCWLGIDCMKIDVPSKEAESNTDFFEKEMSMFVFIVG